MNECSKFSKIATNTQAKISSECRQLLNLRLLNYNITMLQIPDTFQIHCTVTI